jgi:hypothetical protein
LRIQIWLLVTLFAAMPLGRADAAKVQKGFLKRTVAASAEPDRSKFMPFLNEARKVSDTVANAVASGDFAAATSVSSPAAVAQARKTAEDLRRSLTGGKPPVLQYRNQALELVGPQESQTSRVWYVVVAGSKATDSFVAVVVEPSGKGMRVTAVEPLSYAGAIPSWLLSVDAGVAPPKRK